MRTLIDFEIPEAAGRLMLPIIETQGKLEAADNNIDEMTRFIEENCYEIPGAAVKFVEFKEKFLESLEEFQRGDWKERLIRNQVSERFPVGRGRTINQVIIGNLSFKPNTKPGDPYVKTGNLISKEGEGEV
jgi:hypothetical protein